ncbi:hypothetical protein GN956_G20942 [Arapaima gigas]
MCVGVGEPLERRSGASGGPERDFGRRLSGRRVASCTVAVTRVWRSGSGYAGGATGERGSNPTVASPRKINAKPFSSSDSLAKVQEVASWLLEMNQDLLSGGSSRRRRPGGSTRGNASSARATHEMGEEGEEEEHMDRVVEEEQLQSGAGAEGPWAPTETGGGSSSSSSSNGQEAGDQVNKEQDENHVNGEDGCRKGTHWMWPHQQEQQGDGGEENNNSGCDVAQDQSIDGCRCRGDHEEDDDYEEEEMDQDSDDFEQTEESGHEEEEEEEEEQEEPDIQLCASTLRNNVLDTNDNVDLTLEQQQQHRSRSSLPKTKVSTLGTVGAGSQLVCAMFEMFF